jgi:hypothetical protein
MFMKKTEALLLTTTIPETHRNALLLRGWFSGVDAVGVPQFRGILPSFPPHERRRPSAQVALREYNSVMGLTVTVWEGLKPLHHEWARSQGPLAPVCIDSAAGDNQSIAAMAEGEDGPPSVGGLSARAISCRRSGARWCRPSTEREHRPQILSVVGSKKAQTLAAGQRSSS